MKMLKQGLNQGLILKKVHRLIEFNQKKLIKILSSYQQI